jgi:hypothetical protein
VRRVREVVRTARTLTGAWWRVHPPIASIFTVIDKSVNELSNGGVKVLKRSMEEVDLRLGIRQRVSCTE